VGIWLQRTPEAHQTLLLNLAKDSDLEAGIDTLRDLMLDGALRGVPCLYPAPRNGPLLRDLPMPRPQVWTEEALDEYGRQTGLGRWTARVGLWEDREVLVYKAAKIKRLWEQIPDAAVQEGRIYAPDEYDQITNQTEKIHTGIPTLQLIENTRIWATSDSHQVVALEGTEVRYVIEQMKLRLNEHGIPFSGGIFCVGARGGDLPRNYVRPHRFRLGPRRVQTCASAGPGDRRLGLWRVPRSHRLHGPCRRSILLQRSRLPPLR